jgi:hypothetical protein
LSGGLRPASKRGTPLLYTETELPRFGNSSAAKDDRHRAVDSRLGSHDKLGEDLTVPVSFCDRCSTRGGGLPARAEWLHGRHESGPWDVRCRKRIHLEIFKWQRGDDSWCRRGGEANSASRPKTTPVMLTLGVRWSRSPAAASPRTGSAFQSLLESAEGCDVPVRWSCRTGVCRR